MSDIDFKTLSREMAGREGLGGSTIMFTIIALVGLALVWANLGRVGQCHARGGADCVLGAKPDGAGVRGWCDLAPLCV